MTRKRDEAPRKRGRRQFSETLLPSLTRETLTIRSLVRFPGFFPFLRAFERPMGLSLACGF
jgi:hypothetical protein